MNAEFFRGNRTSLIAALKGGNVVVTAYTGLQKSGDMAAEFLQEANFWYLTGIDRPDWQLIIDGTRAKSWLVAPTRDAIHEIFDGSLSPEAAKALSGIDEVITRDESLKLLRDMAKRHAMVYTVGDPFHAEYFDFSLNPAPKRLYEQLSRTFKTVRDCQQDIARLRAIKQPDEIAATKKAIKLTAQTFADVKTKIETMRSEYEIEAEFTYAFRRANAVHAYEPIVAAGRNACTLHYIENDARLHRNQLILIDIGARLGGYTADITRTYSFGLPTKRALEIHQAVREAQAQIIALLEPGLSVQDYQLQVDRIMKQQLVALKLIQSIDDDEGYRHYMPHAISHGLGIDVHDSLGAPRAFEPGMILTVEPGIYAPEHGVGVRIEDDILITSSGHENLSRQLSTDW